MLSSTSILGVKITLNSKEEILKAINSHLSQKTAKPFTIFTPNPEQIVEAQKNKEFRDLLHTADVALPDGEGVVWGLKQLSAISYQLSAGFKRIPGVEFMEDLIKLAAEKKYPVTFVGGRAGVAEKALEKLKEKYVGLEGWAQTPPEFSVSSIKYPIRQAQGRQASSKKNMTPDTLTRDTNEQAVYFEQLVKRIKENGTKLVFVGLGAPKQEYFIEAINHQLSAISSKKSLKAESRELKAPILFMSVGGAFDIFSGKLMRAPLTFRAFHLEWLWRLILEPSRIGRQIKLFEFVWLILKEKFVLK